MPQGLHLSDRCPQSRMSRRSGPAMFAGNTITINDGTFNQFTNTGRRQGFDLLSDKTSPNAFYNAGHTFDPPKCHPNTRVAILDRFKNWLRNAADSQEPNTCILWLNGAAGAGKSTIARSLAEWCDEQKMLLASFFFFRMDSSRNSVENFIPTLAYNTSQTVPDSRQRIEQALHSDPHIFSKTLDVQLARLIIEPLSSRRSHLFSGASGSQLTPERLSQPGAVTPHVFIIDGLDECVDWEGQKALIRLFSTIPNKNLGWKILIASRPEQAIRSSFNEIYSICPFTPVSLSDEYCSDDDIKLYLEDKFAEIKRTHPRGPFIPTDWPSPDDIAILVAKSSGQFIFAATAIRYVSPDSYSPVSRLHSIFNWRNLINRAGINNLPFAELDVLYTQILKTARGRLQDMNPKAVPIVVSLCILIGTDTHFLNRLHESPVDAFSRVLRIDIEDISTILGELSSIISVKDDQIDVYHASLPDFLFNRARSGSLWVNEKDMWYAIVYYCLSTPPQVFKDPRAIWEVLPPFIENARYPPRLAQHFLSFDFVSVVEVTLCPGEMNDLAFMDALFFLDELRNKAMDDNFWLESYHRYVSTFDQWVAGKLQRLCQKTLTHRAYVAFLGSRFSLRLCIEGLHLKRDSDHLPNDFLSDAEFEDWLTLLDEDELPNAQACVFEDKNRLAGIWFCVNFLVQNAITDGAVRFYGDRRKSRPWLSRRRLYSRHFRGKGYPRHLPFSEKVDIREHKWERKNIVYDMLDYVLPTLEDLLSDAPHSPFIVFALRMVDSLILKQRKRYVDWRHFRRKIRRYLIDVAGLQPRGRLVGFGFVGVSNLYRFQGWHQFQNNGAKLP